MKSKLRILLCFLLVLVLLPGTALSVSAGSNTADETAGLIDSILAYKESESGAASVQQWIAGGLAAGAGMTSEWYAFGLLRYRSGNDFSPYVSALRSYVAGSPSASAATRQKYALILIACGYSGDSYVTATAQDSIGAQGIMSWIFGLHLLSNGAAGSCSASDAVSKLLTLQLADGGWAITGGTSDVDVTAMAVQALAPYYSADNSVRSAVDTALGLLSARQLDDGGFQSYGAENPESAAQVLTALCSVGIDPSGDGRFIKNGNTVSDGMLKYRLADGSFCHAEGGSSNPSATMQAMYSLVALWRLQSGLSPLYVFDPGKVPALSPAGASVPEASSEAAETPSAAASSDTAAPDSGIEAAVSAAAPESDSGDPAAGSSSDSPQPADPASSQTSHSAPAGSETSSSASSLPADSSGSGASAEGSGQTDGRIAAILCILAAMAAACIILRLRKKRNIKSYLFILLLGVIALFAVASTKVQSAESYYGKGGSATESSAGTVTMTIRCDTVAGRSDASYIPADGVILPATEFPLTQDETVYGVLVEAAKEYHIQMENKSSAGGMSGLVYISGINYLYEFDFGDNSGWVYHVNGTAPSVGCGNYTLSDGDRIEWLYTCDLGNDVK